MRVLRFSPLSLFVGIVGCASSPETALEVSVPPMPPAASPSSTEPAIRRADPLATCQIEAPEARITVTVAAQPEPFPIRIDGATVVVTPSETGATAAVTGAFVFEGRVEPLELFPVELVEVAGGVVQLGPMSLLQSTSVKGGEVIAKTVEVGSGYSISEVEVPCSVLSFMGSGHPAEAAHQGRKRTRFRNPECPEPCVSYSTPDALEFRATPDAEAFVRLTGSTIVSELERRGAWVRVTARDNVHVDGAHLMGWVELGKLTKLSGGFGTSGGRSMLTAPLIGIVRRRAAKGAGVYQGPARIEAGSRVFDDEHAGAMWATIGDPTAEFEVVIRPGDERAEIWKAPGIPHLYNAWVSAKAVRPSRASP